MDLLELIRKGVIAITGENDVKVSICPDETFMPYYEITVRPTKFVPTEPFHFISLKLSPLEVIEQFCNRYIIYLRSQFIDEEARVLVKTLLSNKEVKDEYKSQVQDT